MDAASAEYQSLQSLGEVLVGLGVDVARAFQTVPRGLLIGDEQEAYPPHGTRVYHSELVITPGATYHRVALPRACDLVRDVECVAGDGGAVRLFVGMGQDSAEAVPGSALPIRQPIPCIVLNTVEFRSTAGPFSLSMCRAWLDVGFRHELAHTNAELWDAGDARLVYWCGLYCVFPCGSVSAAPLVPATTVPATTVPRAPASTP